MGVASSDEARDASRRTRLANERTYLAWWRTGLTTFAVSLAAGRLVPELSSGASWPFEVIGVAFGVVGLLFITYAYVRQLAGGRGACARRLRTVRNTRCSCLCGAGTAAGHR